MTFAVLSCVIALLLPLLHLTALAAEIEFPVSHLENRQVPIRNVPTRCQPGCNPINTQISMGCTISRCCTQPLFDSYVDCYRCTAAEYKFVDHSGAISVFRGVAEQCMQRGIQIEVAPLPAEGLLTWPSSSGPVPEPTFATSSPSSITGIVTTSQPSAEDILSTLSMSISRQAEEPDETEAPSSAATSEYGKSLSRSGVLALVLGSAVLEVWRIL